MSRTTKKTPTGTTRPVVEINYREGLTKPQRQLAEHSVATLVLHATDAAERRRAAEAKQAQLASNYYAPLMKLVEGRAAAVKALAELNVTRLVDFEFQDEPGERVLSRVPPFDFSWHWHHGGAPHRMTADNATGRLSLYARSVGDVRFTNLHAGFGLILRSDHQTTAIGASLRRMGFQWQVGAVGLSSFALSEGGMEFTALEEGRLVASASSTLWRRRVSGGTSAEEAQSGSDPVDVWDPRTLTFTMRPGLGYTFNVGVWVVNDRSTGLAGDALAQGLISGNVSAISIQRT